MTSSSHTDKILERQQLEVGVMCTAVLGFNRLIRCIYDEDMVQSIQYAYSKGHLIGSHGW